MTPRQKCPNFSDCSVKTKKFLWELWTNYEIDDPAAIKLLEILGHPNQVEELMELGELQEWELSELGEQALLNRFS